jgi:hypothetical protein
MLDLLPQSIIDTLFAKSDHRERDLDILECRLKESATLRELAQKHGISWQWVRQIAYKGRRIIVWQLRKQEEARERQGELLAAIKTLEAEAAVYRKIKEVITPHLISEDKTAIPVIPVEDLRCPEMISVRLYRTLRNEGIETLNEAAASLEKDIGRFLKLKNFGKASLAELKELLVKYGIWRTKGA